MNTNELEVLVRKLKFEVEELIKTTDATLLRHDGKIAELTLYIKDNLSNTLRDLIDVMQQSGEIENIILSVLEGFICNVKDMGCIGDGVNDDTKFLQLAIDTWDKIYIPKGTYLITDEIKLKSNLKIYGDGANSILKFKNESDEVKYLFNYNDLESPLYRTIIENIQIISNDVNKLTGGIKVESALRGNMIKNVWFNDVSNPIYLGSKIWGIYSLNNIYANFLPVTMIEEDKEKAIGLYGNSNCIYADNIEMIGSFKYGVYLEKCKVSSITNSNISGSDNYTMKNAFFIKNCDSIKIDTSWIERCFDENGNVNTKSINVVNSNAITINNIYMPSGSLFIDNSKNIDVRNVRYFTNSSGLRCLNNSEITTDKTSLGYCNYQAEPMYSMGKVHVVDIPNDSNENIMNNPLSLIGVAEMLGVSNASVTKSTNDEFMSGDRSLLFEGGSFQGCVVDTSNIVEKDKTYTFIALVKPLSNIDYVYFKGEGMSVVTDYPCNFYKMKGDDTYNVITGTFKVTTNTSGIKILAKSKDVSYNMKLLVDSLFIVNGKHDMSIPTTLDKKAILKTTKLKNSTAPYDGKWEKGDEVYNNFTRSENNSIHKWIYNGTEWISKSF